MPLARLILNAAEEADGLAAELRKRGFAIEIVSPGDVPNYSVDLEIRVEECAPELALRRAEELSKKEDIHVFIAPGAIVESLRPILSVPLIPESTGIMAEAEPTLPVGADELVTAQHLLAEEDVADEVLPIETQPLGEEIFVQAKDPISAHPPVWESPLAEQLGVYALESEEAFPPSDWPIWQPLAGEPQEELASAPAGLATAFSRKPAGSFVRTRQNDRLFWRVAVMASVVAVSTMLLGVSAHRFSPLPHGLSASGDNRLPFQQGRDESLASQNMAEGSPVLAPATPAPELKRVVARMPVTERPSPAEHLGNRHMDRPRRVQSAATRQEDHYIAKDTVVHFGKKPELPRIEAQKKSGIRHYSDLR